MINIFVGLSQNHIDLIQELIIQLEINEDYNILITNKKYNYNSESFNEILLSERGFDNTSKGSLQNLKNIIIKTYNYKKIINELKKYNTKKNITLYFSYIEDVLTNYLLLSFNKNIKGIVFEDGTLNYYNHTIKNVSYIKIIFKIIIGFIIGVPFKKYNGHSSGIEYEHVLFQYVRLPKKSILPNKSKQLKIKKCKIETLNENILIIGQEPFEKILGEEIFKNKFNSLLKSIKLNDSFNKIDTIYYKPHRHGKRIDKTWLTNIFKTKNVVFIKDNNTIENIFFQKITSKYIYTFNSSAVLNIYLSLEDKFKDEIKINVLIDKDDTLVSLYENLNINILER